MKGEASKAKVLMGSEWDEKVADGGLVAKLDRYATTKAVDQATTIKNDEVPFKAPNTEYRKNMYRGMPELGKSTDPFAT